MLDLKIFIGELFAVDRFASRTVSHGEVASLNHEVLDYSMERRALVMEGLARLPVALLPSAQGPEVLGSFGSETSTKILVANDP